ncbi:MAG: NAD(P)-dependent oxidoreductase [Gammaproteobacteria bacterium]|jgi:nucleoside-diphosphate-sugar epimerase
MSTKKIAVIGGSGFIGTRLIPLLLEEGHEVRIVDKNDSAAYPQLRVRGDVRQTSDIVAACKGCDVIYNLAAEHADNVRPLSLYDDVNVQGARNVCDAAEQLGINQLIFTSSVAIYGFSPEELDEDAATNYINDYGRTKLEAEQVYLEWVAKRPDRTLRMIRPTAVFGEGNRGNIYNLIRQLGTKGFVMVGDGENRKSIAYVGNVAAFLTFLLTVNGEQVKIYNYVDKPDLRMNELVPLVRKAFGFGDSMPLKLPYWFVYGMAAVLDMLAALLNRTFPVSRVRIEKFCANSQFATKRLQSSGFEPKFELRDALLRTIRAEFDLAAADNNISG